MRAFARHMTERMKAVAAAGAVAAFWLAVWVLMAGFVAQPLILPGPGAVVVALLRLVCDVGTWAILAGSGARILGGLALAAVCGGVMAGASVRSRTFARLVAPALSFVKATPVACVVVLLLIWLGSARVSIAAVFLMALPGVYFSLVEGLAQVDKPLEQMFRLHGVRGWRLFCAHTWREVLPFVLSCARAVIGMSWKAGVAAELIGMAVGTVGERIYQAKLLIETADLLAWTVLVVAASWACERVLVWLLRASGPAGGRACVMGASGVGKSTLLALAAGECAPCSMVFQDVHLVEDVSALDNVLVCADAHMDASSAAALLRLLVPGVDVHARVAELSGGQRRRVEIARALLCPGDAVILDEPFTGLDIAARDACAEVVRDLLDGRMLLLATHDAVDAQALNISDIITL